MGPRWPSKQFVTLSIVQTLLPLTYGYSLSSQDVVMRQLWRWKRLRRRSLIRSHKRTSMVPCRSCWNGTTNALLPGKIISKGTRVSSVYYQWKCLYEKSLATYLMILVCLNQHRIRYRNFLNFCSNLPSISFMVSSNDNPAKSVCRWEMESNCFSSSLTSPSWHF